MAILVKPVQRANPSDEKAPKKWYVTQVTAAQVDETRRICYPPLLSIRIFNPPY